MKQHETAFRFFGYFVSLLWTIQSNRRGTLGVIFTGSCVFAVEGYGHGMHSFGGALYLGCITALTIGYGDLTPDGPIGRITAILLGTLGIALTGVIVAAMIKALERSMSDR